MSMSPADYPAWLRAIIVITLALFVINLTFFLGPASAYLSAGNKVIEPLTTLAAAFSGAWAAFRFAQLQRDRERAETEVAAGNRALFVLSEYWNTQMQYQKEVIDSYRNRDDAWLNLHATQPFDERATIDVRDLSFLMQSHPGTFQKAILEERRFRLAAFMVKQHSDLVLRQVFPALSKAGVLIKESRSEAEIKQILGPGLVRQLENITAGLIRNTDENVPSSLAAFYELRTALKAVYPKRKFLNVTVKEKLQATFGGRTSS